MLIFLAYVIFLALPAAIIAATLVYAISQDTPLALGVAALDIIVLTGAPGVAWLYSARVEAATGILVVLALVLSVVAAASVTAVALYAVAPPAGADRHT